MRNIDKIKLMSVDEMARFMYELQCEECSSCGGAFRWQDCEAYDCWCHRESGDDTYKQWLLAESEG